MSGAIFEAFEERLQEIELHLDLLQIVENQPKTESREGSSSVLIINPRQQRVLYSTVYLQLYNLVEATAHWCIDAVAAAATSDGRLGPGDLNENLRREWVREIARTHIELNYDNRLNSAYMLCQHLINALPVKELKISRAGNWDDTELEGICRRLGLGLKVSQDIYERVKRPVRNNLGPLALVRELRNQLAHGSISFTECSDGVIVQDLRDLTRLVEAYLREVISSFEDFIANSGFLEPSRRPSAEPQ